jgi:hypothetical protein
MIDSGARRDVTSGIFSLVRETAALALARHGDPPSLAALSSAAGLRGPTGDAARAAWAAFPPRSLDAILFEEETRGDSEEELLDELREASNANPAPAPHAEHAAPGPMLGLLAIGDVRAQRSSSRARTPDDLRGRGAGPSPRSATRRSPRQCAAGPKRARAVAAAGCLSCSATLKQPAAVKRALAIESVRPHARAKSRHRRRQAARVLPGLEPADGVKVMALTRGRSQALVERVLDPVLDRPRQARSEVRLVRKQRR